MIQESTFMRTFDEWTIAFTKFVRQKGKVTPGRYRAYGFEPPSHYLANISDGIRYVRMMAGYPPAGSSPARQQELGLNKDVTWHPKKSEGDKLRE